MEVFLPWEWADPSGYLPWMSIVVVILVGTLAKLLSPRWDDWLDERWGRGSVRDWWLLDRPTREGRGAAPPDRSRR